MERRNFIKNLAALTVVSQIDITKANEIPLDEVNSEQPYILDYVKLTLKSSTDKIELEVSGLILDTWPINIGDWDMDADPIKVITGKMPEPLHYKPDLSFCAKLTEKEHRFINDACTSMYEKIQFTFQIDNMTYEGKGFIWDYEVDLATNECEVKLRINNSNVIYNET